MSSGSNESFSFANAGVRRSVRRALTKRAVKKLSRLGRPAKCRNKERFEARKPIYPFALPPANILTDGSEIADGDTGQHGVVRKGGHIS